MKHKFALHFDMIIKGFQDCVWNVTQCVCFFLRILTLCNSLYLFVLLFQSLTVITWQQIALKGYCFQGMSEPWVTLKHGAYFPPGGHPSLTGVLAQCSLQEEHRDATAEEKHTVRNEKDA